MATRAAAISFLLLLFFFFFWGGGGGAGAGAAGGGGFRKITDSFEKEKCSQPAHKTFFKGGLMSQGAESRPVYIISTKGEDGPCVFHMLDRNGNCSEYKISVYELVNCIIP